MSWPRVGGFLLLSAFVSLAASSCLTPGFEFGDQPASDGNDGGGGPNVVEHCTNRAKDSDEADVDCGGIDCDPCALGRDCRADGDCVNESCTGGKCQDPSCVDDEKNGDESDLNCGGDSCAPCGNGKKCGDDPDCASGVCDSGTCAAPTCTDRVENGNEADVDCGGSCDPCDVGADCEFDEDCEAPPAESGATSDCVGGICVLLCPTGQDDCNERASDGCETNLNTDIEHCGACDALCDPANSVAGKCQGGSCLIDFENGGCTTGFDDCDGDHETGCETNLQNDEAHCGACNEECSSDNGSPTCSSGSCSIDCTDGFDDCDEDARTNGCEVNVASDAQNCNECENECPADGANESPYCDEGVCGVTVCTNGQGDCDGNGSCTDPLDVVLNCGTCGNSCSAPNATAICTNPGAGYQCGIGACASGSGKDWKNCDGAYANGCEVDVLSAIGRCGGCLAADPNSGSGTDCNALRNDPALHVSAIGCDDGGCRITGCTGDYADCDGIASNGCEVDTSEDDGRCGGCLATDPTPGSGVDCGSEWAHADGECNDSACEFTECDSNYGDCENGLADGCETDLRSSEDHCGLCDAACLVNSVTSQNLCNNKICTPVCSGVGQNCDANAWNGCEDRNNDEAHCGACGVSCTTPSGTSSNTCSSGTCAPVCSSPSSRWEACDPSGPNGCEDKQNDEAHCGACGTICQTPTGTTSNTCGSGDCSPVCSGTYRNCDSNGDNGCEVNSASNSTHCGACGVRCGGDSQTNVSGTPTCSSSTCSVSCQAGFCPNTSDPERPCTVPLGTTQNCTSCGQVCQGATPYCTATGCAARLPIQLVNSGTVAVGNTSGDLSFNHTLATSSTANAYRMVVLLLGYKGNNVDLPPPVSYAGNAMTQASTFYSGNQAWAGIYYIKHANLPTTTGAKTVLVDGNQFNNPIWLAEIVELINVDQTASILTTTPQGFGGTSCTGAVSLTIPSVPTDSWMFSVLSVDPNATFTATSGQSLLTEHASGNGEKISGYRANVSGSSTIAWGCTGSSQWAHVVAAFPPEGSD